MRWLFFWVLHEMFYLFQCYNEYGDIIKATMGKAREINKINCALTMCLSLITTYKDIQKANDSIYVSKSSQSFTDLKVIINGPFSQLHHKKILLTNFSILTCTFVCRNWQRDLRFHLVWTQWKIVRQLSHYIGLVFYLQCKTITMQLTIHRHHLHACYSSKFSMNSQTNSWNRTKKLCKYFNSFYKATLHSSLWKFLINFKPKCGKSFWKYEKKKKIPYWKVIKLFH